MFDLNAGFGLILKYGQQFFTYSHALQLEAGQTLQEVEVAYHTYGTLNADKSNVIWICHALTANSDVFDWWLRFAVRIKSIIRRNILLYVQIFLARPMFLFFFKH